MNAIVFRSDNAMRVKLDAKVVLRLQSYAQHRADAPEAGGVLLGRWIQGTRDFVVDDLSVPMKGDRQDRMSFHRSERSHQAKIDRVYKASRGTCGYLGEWHTHPEPDPGPSRTDLDDWRRRLKADRVDVPVLMFVIVGTERTRMWLGTRDNRSLERMDVEGRWDGGWFGDGLRAVGRLLSDGGRP